MRGYRSTTPAGRRGPLLACGGVTDAGDAPGDAPGVADPSGAAELARLRALVGPDERSYDELRADVAAAREAARLAEAEVGRLRGTIAEMQVQLVRARQDQDRYQRWLGAWRGMRDRLAQVKRRVRALIPASIRRR